MRANRPIARRVNIYTQYQFMIWIYRLCMIQYRLTYSFDFGLIFVYSDRIL